MPGTEPVSVPVLPVQLLADLWDGYLRPDWVELPLLRSGSEMILGQMPANHRYLFDMIIGWYVGQHRGQPGDCCFVALFFVLHYLCVSGTVM